MNPIARYEQYPGASLCGNGISQYLLLHNTTCFAGEPHEEEMGAQRNRVSFTVGKAAQAQMSKRVYHSPIIHSKEVLFGDLE